MPKDITLILAYGPDGVLGRGGGLPWVRHAEDMRRFKEATLGHSVIMGRKTFDSLGGALPWRHNIVVTSRPDQITADVDKAQNLKQAFEVAIDDEIFVIGGAKIYQQAVRYANRILLTEMKLPAEGDVYFKIPFIHHWTEVSREEWRGPGDPCDFVELRMV